MRRLINITIVLLLIGATAGGGYAWRRKMRQPPNYRHAEVTHGSIVTVVSATGTVQPVLSVSVGAFVSGPIEGVFVDFNATIKKGTLLAKIDPRLYEAAVAQARALLATRNAEQKSLEARRDQARNDWKRAQALQEENRNFISAAELDQFRFSLLSLEAQVLVAKAAVDQSKAALETSEANLAYTEIRSPVDGVVINRKIDPGQTLAAQFQTPELFIVAPDIKTKMHILASVDEADIGLIHQAKQRGLPVRFTVDAYLDDLFEGAISQIRMSSTTTQNVVTYPVVVAAPNTDLKLMPGMTANLTFHVSKVKEAVRIPNAALRFFPKREHVHPDDRKLVEGVQVETPSPDDPTPRSTAEEKAHNRMNRHRRHVWVEDGEHLRAIAVVTGASDTKHTALVSGGLEVGQKLVTGVRPAE